MQKKGALDIDPPYRSLIEVSVHVCMCIDNLQVIIITITKFSNLIGYQLS